MGVWSRSQRVSCSTACTPKKTASKHGFNTSNITTGRTNLANPTAHTPLSDATNPARVEVVASSRSAAASDTHLGSHYCRNCPDSSHPHSRGGVSLGIDRLSVPMSWSLCNFGNLHGRLISLHFPCNAPTLSCFLVFEQIR